MERSGPRAGTLSRNTLANAIGKLVPGVLTVAVVPLLLPLVGTEGYGLVGLFAAFLIVFATLEVGLTITATRQVARNIALGSPGDRNRNLLRTLEYVYWAVAAAIALVLAAAATPIATHWVNPTELTNHSVRDAIIFAGIAVAARWPISLYKGVLDGLQLQVRQNAVTVAGAILRLGGALPFVAWVDTSITGFMLWQAMATLVELAAMGFFAWRAVGGPWSGARFDRDALRELWRFGAMLTAISVLAALLTQADKFVISYSLPLADLGNYTLAMTAVGPLPLLAAAVAAAALPRFSAQLAGAEPGQLRITFRRAFDAVAFVSIWVSMPLIFFSHQILSVWTGSERVADACDEVLSLLAVAYLLNALYTLPYALILAAGHGRIPLLVNAVSVPVVVAVTVYVVPKYGLVGAALIWLLAMAAHLCVYGAWVRRHLISWRVGIRTRSLGLYLVGGLTAFGLARALITMADDPVITLAAIVAAVAFNTVLAAHLLPEDLRHAAADLVKPLRRANRPE
jgi:O-antigen/teichoic acid export membrane protein